MIKPRADSLKSTGRLAARRGLVLAVAVGLLGAAACGFKTDPRPPEYTAPVINNAPEAEVDGTTVELVWKRAETSADGRELYDLAGFIVERSSGSAPYGRIDTVAVTDQEKLRRQARFRYDDEQPPLGMVSYRVRAFTADGQEGPPSPAVAVEVVPAVDPGESDGEDTEETATESPSEDAD